MRRVHVLPRGGDEPLQHGHHCLGLCRALDAPGLASGEAGRDIAVYAIDLFHTGIGYKLVQLRPYPDELAHDAVDDIGRVGKGLRAVLHAPHQISLETFRFRLDELSGQTGLGRDVHVARRDQR